MYICADCNEVSNPREGLNKVTLQTRKALYKDSTGRQIAEGTEIVKEIGVCTECFEERNVAKVETFLNKQVSKVLARGL